MKEIKLAKSAGFCFGVEKAVDTVYKEIKQNNKEVYTLGPIIHNQVVVDDFQKNGVKVLDNLENIKTITDDATIIIRSHGVTKKVHDICQNSGKKIVDATCPYVKKIHGIVQRKAKEGYFIVIIGNPKHPEVEGIKGWGLADTAAINSYEEFLNLNIPKNKKICIVSQTTYNHNKFKEILEKIDVLGYDISCFNTICNATHERQVEAKELASKVDAMIVIGDKGSSNTGKLVEICKKECENTIFIQTAKDLNPKDLLSVCNVGITAGASTPKHIIEEVQSNVRP